jgi:hypothetical protein
MFPVIEHPSRAAGKVSWYFTVQMIIRTSSLCTVAALPHNNASLLFLTFTAGNELLQEIPHVDVKQDSIGLFIHDHIAGPHMAIRKFVLK